MFDRRKLMTLVILALVCLGSVAFLFLRRMAERQARPMTASQALAALVGPDQGRARVAAQMLVGMNHSGLPIHGRRIARQGETAEVRARGAAVSAATGDPLLLYEATQVLEAGTPEAQNLLLAALTRGPGVEDLRRHLQRWSPSPRTDFELLDEARRHQETACSPAAYLTAEKLAVLLALACLVLALQLLAQALRDIDWLQVAFEDWDRFPHRRQRILAEMVSTYPDIPAMLWRASRDDGGLNPVYHRAAIGMLARLKDHVAFEVLRRWARHPDKYLARTAVHALGAAPGPIATGFILTFLEREDDRLAVVAAECLVERDATEALPRLYAKSYDLSAPPEIRDACLDAIAKLTEQWETAARPGVHSPPHGPA